MVRWIEEKKQTNNWVSHWNTKKIKGCNERWYNVREKMSKPQRSSSKAKTDRQGCNCFLMLFSCWSLVYTFPLQYYAAMSPTHPQSRLLPLLPSRYQRPPSFAGPQKEDSRVFFLLLWKPVSSVYIQCCLVSRLNNQSYFHLFKTTGFVKT